MLTIIFQSKVSEEILWGGGIFSEDGAVWGELDGGGTLLWMTFPGNFPVRGLYFLEAESYLPALFQKETEINLKTQGFF